ncbi:hypothetical protein FDP41_001183 [Naegleria fowleri]|uniref:F-box domain-containing protein n=1 Tax=Naegleria fowleri TaxID=5763 RepID=A0A6A5C2F2_NAEFO|nr:uncharacterized protein FDP41_001183 [Naegleria fowleri]KAF0980030.1 hypothetical protein FDP41_001183 [Naegleria fowleri]CAG4717440.1 unnamed protein product [Naegleria fowleri]
MYPLCRDVLFLVALYLNLSSLSSFRLVSREWNSALDDYLLSEPTNKDISCSSSSSQHSVNTTVKTTTIHHQHLFWNEFWMDKLKSYFWKYLECLEPIPIQSLSSSTFIPPNVIKKFNRFIISEKARIQRHVKRLENKKKKLLLRQEDDVFILDVRRVVECHKQRALGMFKNFLLVDHHICNYVLKWACEKACNGLDDEIIRVFELFKNDLVKSEELLECSLRAMKYHVVDELTLDKFINTTYCGKDVTHLLFDNITCFSFEQFKQLAHHFKESPKTDSIRKNTIIYLFKQALWTDDIQNIDMLTEILEKKLGKPLFDQSIMNQFLNSYDDSTHPYSKFWNKHKILRYMQKKFNVCIGEPFIAPLLFFSLDFTTDSIELIEKIYQGNVQQIEQLVHVTMSRLFRSDCFRMSKKQSKSFLFQALKYLVLTFNVNLFSYVSRPSSCVSSNSCNLLDYLIYFSISRIDWEAFYDLMAKQVVQNGKDVYHYFVVENEGSIEFQNNTKKLNLASLKNSQYLKTKIMSNKSSLGNSPEIEFFEQKTNLIPHHK